MNKDRKDLEIYDEPSVFAVPCDKPFVVSSDKVKEFLLVKSTIELTKKREELLKKLNIKAKIEPIKIKGPVLKKTK